MKIVKIMIVAFLIIIGTQVKAQRTDAMYFVGNSSQSSLYNPAKQGDYNMYISLPIISKFSFDFHTSGFCWKDLINQNPNYPDSLRMDIDGFSKKLKDDNFIDNSFTMDLLGFGFRINDKNFISFNLLLNVDSRLNFSKGLFDLLVYGTDNPNNSLKFFNNKLIDATAYISPSVSYSYKIDDKWTVGARLKMYFGLANINTKKSDISLQFNDDDITAIGDIDIREANAFYKYGFTTLTDGDSVEDGEFESSKIMSNIMKNKGYGIDLGVTYKLREDMELSASVVDLGRITWKSNAKNIKSRRPNESVTFSGVNTNYDDLSDDVSDYLDDMADSLKHAFDLETKTMSSYTTHLPTKIYLGYSWNFQGHNYLQALLKGRSIGGTFEKSLMIAYAFKTSFLDVSVGNTINNKFFNPNVTLSLTGGGINFYVGTTINSSLNMANASGFSIYTGLGIVVGKHKTKANTNEINNKDNTQLEDKK
jgi:hypothetical protein